jgi:hypothetical protein
MTPRRMEQSGWQPVMPPIPIHSPHEHRGWPLLVPFFAYTLLSAAIVAAALVLLHFATGSLR